MTQRGRGTLHIRQDSHPFYQTSKGSCDKTVTMHMAGATTQAVPDVGLGGRGAEGKESKSGIADFMYRTSSGSYGTKIPLSGNKLAEAMDAPAVQPAGSCQPTKDKAYTMRVELGGAGGPSLPSWKDPLRADKLASGWKQEQTTQHPMYQTSASAIGVKAPTITEMGTKYCPVTNKFTHSFNSVKVRDHGLNTALQKSKVHASVGYK